MPLVVQPVLQYTQPDVNGVLQPLAFAEAHFSLTGGTTPTVAYQDSDLTIELTNPVIADDEGFFPPMFVSREELIRMRIIATGGDLGNPLIDVDPVNELFTVGAANIEDGAIEEKLGYIPVDPDNAIFTQDARLNFTATAEEGLQVDSIGFRGTPINVKDLAYVLVLDDSGKMIVVDDTSGPAWTIPPHSTVGYPLGTTIHLYNGNTGNATISRGVGVHLTEAGDVGFTDEAKTLPPGYVGKITQHATDEWVLSPGIPKFILSATGQYNHVGGFKEKWGRVNTTLSQDENIAVDFTSNLLDDFLVACYGVSLTPIVDADTNADVSLHIVGTPDVTGFTLKNQSASAHDINGFFWRAWGK
jgi:hypothetical protein